jgi:acetolactate synthase-1/2/3 large subunit
MQQTGAWLARYALEQLGIRYPFGIPGGHNTQLYDEPNNSTTAGCPAAATGRR